MKHYISNCALQHFAVHVTSTVTHKFLCIILKECDAEVWTRVSVAPCALQWYTYSRGTCMYWWFYFLHTYCMGGGWFYI